MRRRQSSCSPEYRSQLTAWKTCPRMIALSSPTTRATSTAFCSRATCPPGFHSSSKVNYATYQLCTSSCVAPDHTSLSERTRKAAHATPARSLKRRKAANRWRYFRKERFKKNQACSGFAPVPFSPLSKATCRLCRLRYPVPGTCCLRNGTCHESAAFKWIYCPPFRSTTRVSRTTAHLPSLPGNVYSPCSMSLISSEIKPIPLEHQND